MKRSAFLLFLLLLLSAVCSGQKDTKGTVKNKKADSTGAGSIICVIQDLNTSKIIYSPTSYYARPEFPGGRDSMKAFINSRLVYPANSKYKGIHTKCEITLTINETGKITKIYFNKGATGCFDCDNEAVRILKEMPNWKPGKEVSGKNTTMEVRIEIPFNFPE